MGAAAPQGWGRGCRVRSIGWINSSDQRKRLVWGQTRNILLLIIKYQIVDLIPDHLLELMTQSLIN